MKEGIAQRENRIIKVRQPPTTTQEGTRPRSSLKNESDDRTSAAMGGKTIMPGGLAANLKIPQTVNGAGR